MAKTVAQTPRNMNVLKPLLVSIGFVLFIIYALISMNTRDWLWFMANTEISEPVRIIVKNDGERLTYMPGDAEFERLAPVIETAISDLNNTALIDVGLSDNTLEDYNELYTVVEVHYDNPLKFGTHFRTGEPTELLFPITGRHSGTGLFFRGNKGEWHYGALRMADPAILYSELQAMGFESAAGSPTNNSNGGNASG